MVKRGQAILYSPTFSSTYTAETNGDEPPLNKDDKRRKGKSKGHYKLRFLLLGNIFIYHQIIDIFIYFIRFVEKQ